MINNSASSEAAQLLGNKYREAREKNNVSLIQASEQLKIRSYLLNDMEKGRFGHLKLGDCLAYAKYLSADVNVEELNAIRQAQGGAEEPYELDKRVVVGGGVVIGVVALAVLFFALSGKEDKTEVSDNGVLQLPQEQASGVIELPVANQQVDVELPVPASQNVQPENSVKPAPAPVLKQDVEQGVVVGPERKDTIVEEEIQFESLPDADPLDVPVVATPAPARRPSAPAQNTVVMENPAANRAQTDNVKPAEAPAKKPQSVPAEAPVKKAQNTPARNSSVNQKPQASTSQTRTSVHAKSSGLKSGQVVSLADEMGYKKSASPSKAAQQKSVQKTAPVKQGNQSVKKTAQPAVSSTNASSAAKSGNLKSGQVVSLADEMGYRKPAAKTAPAVKAPAPASKPKANNSGSLGPKITDQAEIKRRASQVVITEAVQ